MFKCSNDQMIKWSNVQMFKSSNVQMLNFSNVQMLKCSNDQMYKFPSVQLSIYSNLQMLKCSNAQMLKCSNVQIFKWSNVSMFQCSNDQIFQSLESSESNVQIFDKVVSLLILCFLNWQRRDHSKMMWLYHGTMYQCTTIYEGVFPQNMWLIDAMQYHVIQYCACNTMQ